MTHLDLADRRCALQALYQMDAANSQDRGLVGVTADDGEPASADSIDRGMLLAAEAWKIRNEADAEVALLAKEWPPYRQPVVDRNLLRMGWYELRRTDAPPRKVISDAVEIAKEFGTLESSKFINAVLDRLWKGADADAGDAGGVDAGADAGTGGVDAAPNSTEA